MTDSLSSRISALWMLFVFAQWTANCIVQKNPGILTKVVKGNPCGSDLVFGAWSPKWGAHSGLFVHLQYAPVLHKPSQHSFCCFFMLFYQRFHCSRVWSWPDCQAGAPIQDRHHARIKRRDFFYWGWAVKSQSSSGHNDTGTIRADMTTRSSFPQGDVVIHLSLYQR